VPFKVLITSPKYANYGDYVRDYLSRQGCEQIAHADHPTMDTATLARYIPDADALIVGSEAVTPTVFAAAPRLKVVCAQGVGYDHIDVAAATAHGAVVAICAGANNRAVAELALGFMLNLARNIAVTDRGMRNGEWPLTFGPELWGKTLGIIGLGRVGKSLALIAEGLGMRVLAADIAWDITFADAHGVHYVPLPTLLAQSDFVSLHCPLNETTRSLIDAAALARMKPTAYLINTARGPIVHEPALADALRAGQIAGAGMDVFAIEPNTDNLFVDLPNFVMTSHRGGASHEAIERSIELGLLNVTSVLHGRDPVARVN